MVNTGPRTKKKEVDLKKLGEDLLKFAQDNSSEKMELDIVKAKKSLDSLGTLSLKHTRSAQKNLKSTISLKARRLRR